jgi:ribosomal protein S12 methylthiotransferase
VLTRPKYRLHMITMGCVKNVVDSERLLAQLEANAVEICPSLDGADIAVINTCGFIDAAKEESIRTILETARQKSGGALKRVYAVGCLTERYRDELAREIPELDGVFGVEAGADLLRELGLEYRYALLGERKRTGPRHTASLKVSEGCDNPCSFCAIPLMRGTHRSQSLESIVEEATRLSDDGVREIVLIGQDTTAYGLDRYGRRRLAEVLTAVADVHGIEWVRLMYAFPSQFPEEVLEVIAGHPCVCKYLDIPVQHAADPVLRSMRRGISARALRRLLETIRSRVPGIALRTTLIVGYPAEGVAEFQELLALVREIAFERLGVFTYSQEEGTHAYDLGDPVPRREKERRRDQVMQLQGEISKRWNEALVGRRFRVLVDRQEGRVAIGRTEFDAPDVDNEVILQGSTPLEPGSFHEVEIVRADVYDVFGVVHKTP